MQCLVQLKTIIQGLTPDSIPRLKAQGDIRRGEKGRDMINKDVDRLKKRTEDAESKVRSLVREKADLMSEKSGLQRQIKGMEKTLEHMTKDLRRKESTFDKRREHLVQVMCYTS